MTNCLSIIVAKLKADANYVGNELPEPSDGGLGPYYDEYIELNAVTRLSVRRELVYDEGDVRVLYHDHFVEVEAVLDNNNLYGPLVEPEGDADAYTFDEKLEIIYNFLANQGLGINLGEYPAAIKRLAPGTENNVNGTYTGYHGWLVDNFNGPRVDDLEFISLPGNEATRLVWRLRFRTFHTDVDQSSEASLIPKISSELRLDIDKDGDIVIIVYGAVYADSLQALYSARNWLEVVYQPADASGIRVYSRGQPISEDKFAMVNGFHKTVKFNVEKNGRSARFNITYTQVKSNNAYPLGLRDIEFVQTIESNLFASSFTAGKGFRSWKMGFKGKIKVPPRLNPEYAWYVFHLLIQQQMRNTLMSFDSKAWNNEEDQLVENENEVDPRMTVKKKYARALPVRMKMQHSHYQRELIFEVDFVIICPIKYVLAVSCILNRVNNDYQRRLDDHNRQYKPLRLSHQWFNWNRSVDPSIGFDPESANAVNPTASNRPHRDTAGTEIVDTGHNYDPYKALDAQSRQRNVLITTVFDPHEKDNSYEGIETQSQSPGVGIPGGNFSEALEEAAEEDRNYGTPTWRNLWKGIKPFSPFFLLTDVRGQTPQYDPKTTWLKYEQDYEIIEDNGSFPVEGLADMDERYYQNPQLANKYAVPIPDPYLDSEMPPQETGAKFLGRTGTGQYERSEMELDEYEFQVAQEQNPNPHVITQRKTYATRPTRFFVVVRGVAVRVKHKIPMPQVISIAGQQAIRVGAGRFRHKNLAPDADLPVYMAMWEQVYTVDKTIISEDILNSIVDTGATMLYA